MGVRPARRRPQLHVAVGVALYAAFLVTAPFEHHDLVCHIKTPLHCSACASSLASADPSAMPRVTAAQLADAGRALAVQSLTDGFLLAVASTGRSPPSFQNT